DPLGFRLHKEGLGNGYAGRLFRSGGGDVSHLKPDNCFREIGTVSVSLAIIDNSIYAIPINPRPGGAVRRLHGRNSLLRGRTCQPCPGAMMALTAVTFIQLTHFIGPIFR